MSDADDLLISQLRRLPTKPDATSRQSDKKRYSELMSAAAARALGEALRRKGAVGTLPLLDDNSAASQIGSGPAGEANDEETGE